MAVSSRRLELIFGVPLEQVGRTDIEALVTIGIAEDFDLDFKSTLYGTNDTAKRDLAGDIAALANTAGGVIVLGVIEDAQAKASGVQPVALSDDEVRRMRLIVASGVAPVPSFDIIPVTADSPTSGYYLIAVPRSTSAPHGVLINDGFRYPVRNGTTTRYLSEAEVSAAYRERFLGAGRQAERSERLIEDARLKLAPEASWVVLSLVPEVAGQMDITQAGYTAFQNWASAAPKIGINDAFLRYGVRPRRYVADGGNRNAHAEWVLLEAHADGSGVYAVQVTDESGDLDDATRVSTLGENTLAAGVIVGLRTLAMHAEHNAHTSGSAMVRAELVPAATANAAAFPAASGHGYSRAHPSQVDALEAATTSTMIEELTGSGRTELEVAAGLLHQIGHQFGVPEVAMVRRDGTLNPVDWNRTMLEYLRRWAADAGVDLQS